MSYNSAPMLFWPGRFTLDDGRDRSPAYYFYLWDQPPAV